MKEKVKCYLFKAMLLSIYFIGISTVDATSRFTGYQPEESEELIDMVRKLRVNKKM